MQLTILITWIVLFIIYIHMSLKIPLTLDSFTKMLGLYQPGIAYYIGMINFYLLSVIMSRDKKKVYH